MSRISQLETAVGHYRDYRFDRPRPARVVTDSPPRVGEEEGGERPSVVRRRERPHVGRFLDLYA